MKTSTSKSINSKVSFKESKFLTGVIKGKNVAKVKKYLENLHKRKVDLDGKYYPKTVEKLLELVKNAEANAKSKKMNVERLFIKNAYANKAEKRNLGKSKLKLRGRIGKSANINIILEER
ncbi:MAG: hypothetical protein HYW22_01015 [Candidatus Aenigmarchaeota archaeon]|nr:hypothetical protein [Candidatus Aenigmarchaeota archaeon]